MKDPEVILAFMVWTSGVLYSLFAVFHAGHYFQNFEDKYRDFQDGWLIQGRQKDVADNEFQMFFSFFSKAWFWLILNLCASEWLRFTKLFKFIPTLRFLLALSFTINYVGILGSLLVLHQPMLFQVFYKFKRKVFIWSCSAICLILITYLKSVNFEDFSIKSLRYTDSQHYFLIISLCWMNLRCVSYYLDLMDTKTTERNLIQVLDYCFYLPTLILGPFIPFSNFKRNPSDLKNTLPQRLGTLLLSTLRFGTWFIVTEYFLHYVYVNAISFQTELVRNFNSWTLYGYGYGMGQFFHLKYVIFYGISTSLAKFEHIEVPSIPKCIGRIHLYSDMWRYFDVGLYKFLIRYIYLPTLTKKTPINKMYSSFLCFLFVYVWHGIQSHILVWVVLNFVGITLENIFTNIFNFYNLHKCLNYRVKRILLCILASPLLVVSALSNFYFFAGMEIGLIFTERLLLGPWYPTAVLLFFLSCCGCVSIEIGRWELQQSNKVKEHNVKNVNKSVKIS